MWSPVRAVASVARRGLASTSPRDIAKRLDGGEVQRLGQRLGAVIGGDNVALDEAVRRHHGQDEGPDEGLKPDVVVFPANVEEVSEVCKICFADNIPIIPFGTGTGMESGVSAVFGGVCVDMSRMNQIVALNPQDFDATVQPGVTREQLNHECKSSGLWFPVDPGANASLCGMCATSASGTNAVRYGTMKENTLNLQVVLADGRVLHTAGERMRARKSSAGYNLTDVFVGSEGTLGIITQASLRLYALPEVTASAVVSFPSIAKAVETVVSVLQCSLPVARMELLDELAIKACNSYSHLSLAEEPTLFLEFHSSAAGLEYQTSTVAELAKANGGSDFAWATKTEDRTKLWTARHKLLYASLALRPGSRSVTTDVCVPVSKLPEMISAAKEDVEKAGIIGPVLGHVGDGNFHVLLLFLPEDRDEYARCKKVSLRMAETALRLGGTCTGEHGVGTGKIDVLRKQFGDVGVDAMAAVKRALDTKGIMNPGKVINVVDT